MNSNSKIMRFFSLMLFALGFLLVNGSFSETSAQNNDPFKKPVWQAPKAPGKPSTVSSGGTSTNSGGNPQQSAKKEPPPVIPLGAPSAQERINRYLQVREINASQGLALPKITSYLTLGELQVTGIFRTPRGYSAIVLATPVNLSYTIYPGEKFFDGQLVAIEENRLVFRKVTKMSNNKFVSMEEAKPLRKYTEQEAIQGTAPAGETTRTETATANPTAIPLPNDGKTTAPVSIVSPLEEMNNQPAEKTDSAKDKKDKKGKSGASNSKKSVKVATKKGK